MSYPGRLYLLDPSRNWPGLPLEADGRVRVPIWNKDVPIKEGTEFYNRILRDRIGARLEVDRPARDL